MSVSTPRKMSEINAEHEAWLEQQPTTTRCAWCRWKFRGTAVEAREKFAEHRRDEHPDVSARTRDQIVKQQRRERDERAQREREEAALRPRPALERPVRTEPPAKWRKWTREEALAGLREVAVELGHPPSASQAKRDKRIPSNPTICNIFGSYGDFIVAGGFERPTRATRYPKSTSVPQTSTREESPAAPEPEAAPALATDCCPRLPAFLYLLLRDELPGGVVERIVRELESAKGKTFTYSNEHYAAFAREIAGRLLQSPT